MVMREMPIADCRLPIANRISDPKQPREPPRAVWTLDPRPSTFDVSLSCLPQLFRFVRRRPHGAHHRAAQFALLEFMQAFDRRAARTRDHVFERARMLAGFED